MGPEGGDRGGTVIAKVHQKRSPRLRSLIRDSMLRSIYKDGADDGIVDDSSMIEDV